MQPCLCCRSYHGYRDLLGRLRLDWCSFCRSQVQYFRRWRRSQLQIISLWKRWVSISLPSKMYLDFSMNWHYITDSDGNTGTGDKDTCLGFDDLQVQCTSGICKNYSSVYQCEFNVSLALWHFFCQIKLVKSEWRSNLTSFSYFFFRID